MFRSLLVRLCLLIACLVCAPSAQAHNGSGGFNNGFRSFNGFNGFNRGFNGFNSFRAPSYGYRVPAANFNFNLGGGYGGAAFARPVFVPSQSYYLGPPVQSAPIYYTLPSCPPIPGNIPSTGCGTTGGGASFGIYGY